jgi:redox-sensitive bicupin YhaK (pirin superfamily)
MNAILHKANQRGHANHDWLDAWHSFSFAEFHDPKRTHFGLLRVLNDDTIAPGMGFGTHPHDNMEIVTIPLEGALEHQDSTGGSGVIRRNEVQVMSAGSGLKHSEFNHSKTEAVKLFQIWVFPKLRNITPRYDQRLFDPAARTNSWQVVAGGKERPEALQINQDAYFSLGNLQKGKTLDYSLIHPGNGVYFMLVSGQVACAEQILDRRDALAISDAPSFSIKALEDSELLVVEIPLS